MDNFANLCVYYYEMNSFCEIKNSWQYFPFSESSQAAKYGGCFSADSTVRTSTGARRKLSELQIGESILAYDVVESRLVYSDVIMFLDWDPEQNREFLHLELASGKTLTVTPTHLLLIAASNASRTIYAEQLQVGDRLLVRDSNELVVKDVVVRVRPVLRKGVFAPLTTTGTVVVDDVVASCYAVVDSQRIAHWAFAPVRLIFSVRTSINRLWDFVSFADSTTKKSISPAERGVHWYPKMLYTVANYLLSSHLHK